MAVTGASGAIYAEKILHFFLEQCERIYLIVSDAGRQVVDFELKTSNEPEHFSLKRCLSGSLNDKEKEIFRIFDSNQLFAPVASGSNSADSMIIVPCSMGSLSRIAHGTSSNLIERSADVMIKSQKPLVLCPRETPLSAIHLSNMLELARLGVQIVPPVPAFYHLPKTLDDSVYFVVGRLVEALGFEHKLYAKWNDRMA